MRFWEVLLILYLAVAGSCAPEETERYGYEYKKIVWICYDSVRKMNFGFKNTNFYSKMVDYPPSAGTLLNCIANDIGADSKYFNKSIARIQEYSHLYGHYNYTVDQIYDMYINATDYIIDVDLKKTNLTATKFFSPVNLTQSDIATSYAYYTQFYYNFDQISTLATINYFYFIFVFILFGTSNLIKRLGYQKYFNNRFINWYRSNISIPALFNGKHTEAPSYLKVFSTLVPTRVESIVVFFFICLNALLTAINFDPVADYTSVKITVQIYRNLADRTGLLSFGLIPLLIIFAGRNNILVSITGIPYTSFIFYHKWVARLMWIHALIHSVCWTAYGIYYKYLTTYETEAYWRWGVVATVAGGMIIFQAFHAFRNMAYETFLVLHIVLVIVFVIACWYHCYDLGWLEWIYTSFAVWGFDRLARLYRMFMFGFPKAGVEYVGLDTFKISVKHSKRFSPFPGAFGYVYFITPTQFWQSHPFTIIKSSTSDDETYVFVKAKKGITKSIMKKIEASDGKKIELRICIEGPYGHRAPVEKYDTALLLAGGNGIPGPLSYAVDLASRELRTNQQVKLIWVIRSAEYLTWFNQELIALVNSHVNVDIFITSKDSNTIKPLSEENTADCQSSTEESKADSKSDIISTFDLPPSIQLHYGRPNINELISEEFTTKNNGTIGIVTCGPPAMVDSIRAAVAKNLTKSENRVDLFEELQVW
ncbi:hypothetical protein WICMUC_003632 [Wickerhamomyces mucosus]|uniref:ferric-chelate reductase (NADPH) n=1 Tax=Wickerhamomyces mucosus TaxID=1378264 RepID=A0A9P8PK66_9ASCO|nr:hypothetical protein WICMUC_003632 [Wickerhamomyces mucosus]